MLRWIITISFLIIFFSSFGQDLKRKNPDYLSQDINNEPALVSDSLQLIKSNIDSAMLKTQDSLRQIAQAPNDKTGQFNEVKNEKLDSLDVEITPPSVSPIEDRLGIEDANIEKSLPSTGQLKHATDINGPEYDISLPQDGLAPPSIMNETDLPGADVRQRLQKYTDETPGVQDIDSRIDQQAAGIDELQPLQQEHSIPEQWKGPSENTVEGIKPDLEKDQLKEKALQEAKEQLLQHQDELEAAKQNLGKYKKNYPKAESIKDLPKQPRNLMQDKPMRERLVPGLMLQIHNGQPFDIDFSPQIAYYLTGRLSAGIGATYRLGVQAKVKPLLSHPLNIYGVRAFTEFKVVKGFYAHVEWEQLYYKSPSLPEESRGVWTTGIPAGIGKQYKLFGIIEGNTQVLFHFARKADTPYQNKWLIRTGINLKFKAK